MTVPLSASQRLKLARVLGLLGSDKAGERDAAGLAAHRMISSAGLSWEAVLSPQLSGPDPDDEQPYTDGWCDMVTKCHRHLHLLNDFERGFLDNVGFFPRLSLKQRSVLNRIVAKLKVNGCRL